MKIIAVLLIVVGAISLLYGGFSYTRREKVLDLGPIEATRKTTSTVPLPPLLGGVLLACGVGLLIVSAKKR